MEAVTPTVWVVGYTTADIPAGIMDGVTPNGESLVEFAGRVCYQSFDKPNPKTAKTGDYIRNVIRQRHFSVIEHVSVSFYITGVSRNCSHELVRHRHFSFSELSQRYVDPLKAGLGFVSPPAAPPEILYDSLMDSAVDDYRFDLGVLAAAGVKGKRAREVARAVLPGMVETRLVMTGNLRSWMEFVSKRDHPAADAEIQRLAKLIYGELCELYPAVFECRDVWDEGWCQSEPTV